VRRHQALFWLRCRGGKVKGTHIHWRGVNSTNVLDEGLRIGGRGRWMNLKVRLVEISVYRK
jgi:hypothetical protein